MCFKKKNFLKKVPDDIIIYMFTFLDLPKQKIYFNTYKSWYIKDTSLIKMSETNKKYYYLVNNPYLWKFN